MRLKGNNKAEMYSESDEEEPINLLECSQVEKRCSVWAFLTGLTVLISRR